MLHLVSFKRYHLNIAERFKLGLMKEVFGICVKSWLMSMLLDLFKGQHFCTCQDYFFLVYQFIQLVFKFVLVDQIVCQF